MHHALLTKSRRFLPLLVVLGLVAFPVLGAAQSPSRSRCRTPSACRKPLRKPGGSQAPKQVRFEPPTTTTPSPSGTMPVKTPGAGASSTTRLSSPTPSGSASVGAPKKPVSAEKAPLPRGGAEAKRQQDADTSARLQDLNQKGFKTIGLKPRYTHESNRAIWNEKRQGQMNSIQQQLGRPTQPVQRTQVRYLTKQQRQKYRVTIKDGRLYDADGNLLDTRAATSAHSGGGNAIYVMDKDGNIYVSKTQEVGEFHHSSLGGGEPVAGAGELRIREGRVVGINRKSGHYQPGEEHLQQVVDHLRSQGVDIDSSAIDSGVQ
jgi:hypothetical protein